ncbi:MAG: Ig-like domain-containing protein [Desulfobacterales bacterium]|nr:Ig-like domain-containing protein [Desulfobacterales bacterium]
MGKLIQNSLIVVILTTLICLFGCGEIGSNDAQDNNNDGNGNTTGENFIFQPAKAEIIIGSNFKLNLIYTYENQSTNITDQCNLSSSDPNVASVNQNGELNGIKEGSTTVTATYTSPTSGKELSASFNATVTTTVNPKICYYLDQGVTFTPVTGCNPWPDGTKASGWKLVCEASGIDYSGAFQDGTQVTGHECTIQINCP